MSAGVNVFFTMVILLPETEAVRVSVITVVWGVVVITGKGVSVTLVTVTAGCTGGESEHPQVRMKRSAMVRSTGIDLIDAGRSFPYNKMVVVPEIRKKPYLRHGAGGSCFFIRIQETVDALSVCRKSSP
jgi:hypothetical protein